jgi:PAS domain-containing protein
LAHISVGAGLHALYIIQYARAFLEIFNSILGSIREPLVVLDPDLKVIKANPSFYRTRST